ncbi:MAG: HU family DNA-binding protein [Magnetococcus sp. WYHC-3]
MSEAYTKHDLVKELAQAAGISKRKTEIVLETLTKVAYREAHKGFAVPGICRLDVVHRHARLVRNPQTHETLKIAEHDALRVRPLKRAKNAIAPTPHGMVQIVTEPEAQHATPPAVTAESASTTPAPAATPGPTPAPTPTPAAAAAPTPAPAAAPATPAAQRKPYTVVPPPVIPKKPSAPPSATAPATATGEEEQFVSFRCKQCSQEIEAPHDMVGAANECPTCGEHLIVPYTSEPGTIWYRERANASEKVTLSAGAIAAMKGRTIRIDLPDDL